MQHIITTEYLTKRIKSSGGGNPRYELWDLEGNFIASTRPDSSLAYGEVPNNAGRGVCKITVHETKGGRLYVDNVEKIEEFKN